MEYDHEVWEIETRYRSFAEFLQAQALDMTEDLEYFLGKPENDRVAEQLCEYWANYLG